MAALGMFASATLPTNYVGRGQSSSSAYWRVLAWLALTPFEAMLRVVAVNVHEYEVLVVVLHITGFSYIGLDGIFLCP